MINGERECNPNLKLNSDHFSRVINNSQTHQKPTQSFMQCLLTNLKNKIYLLAISNLMLISLDCVDISLQPDV